MVLKVGILSKDLDKLQYCEAVIKEVSRHRPIVYANARMNVEKDEVGGFIWPEETSFQILYSAILKRKDYWTDPEKFDPDRFYKIEESDKYLLEKQHAKNSFSKQLLKLEYPTTEYNLRRLSFKL